MNWRKEEEVLLDVKLTFFVNGAGFFTRAHGGEIYFYPVYLPVRLCCVIIIIIIIL